MKKEPPSSQMKQIRWQYAIPLVLGIALAVDYYVLHILFPIKQQALIERSLQEMTPSEKVVFEESKKLIKVEATPDVAHAQKESEFRMALIECAPEVAAQGIGTPEALLNYLDKSIGVASESIEIENYNFTLPDGTERRIHLIPADNSNAKNARELRYYKLDAEGLPERIYLPKNEAFNPSPEFIQRLMKDSNIHLHQVKKNWTLKDESRLATESINDKINSFQLFLAEKTLSCQELECGCR